MRVALSVKSNMQLNGCPLRRRHAAAMEKGCCLFCKQQEPALLLRILIGLLATVVEPICDAQDAFYLVRLVSNKLDLLHVLFGASAQLKRR